MLHFDILEKGLKKFLYPILCKFFKKNLSHPAPGPQKILTSLTESFINLKENSTS